MKPAAPLLLIDVDGVISLFGFDQTEPPDGRFAVVDGIPHLIAARAGDRLARLAETFECVWCTGWEDRADEHLPHLLDLPGGWAHLTFARAPAEGVHWKLEAIEAHAGPDRPVAWVDDAHDASCERWAAERPGPTLLLATEPHVGLTDEHVTTLLSWASAASG
jgi:HAD domain in Swiss Army Knife RNA repair proteins